MLSNGCVWLYRFGWIRVSVCWWCIYCFGLQEPRDGRIGATELIADMTLSRKARIRLVKLFVLLYLSTRKLAW